MSIGTWVGYPRSYTSGRRMPVQVVVVHHTAGSEGPSSAESGAAYDKTRTDGVSTHAFADSNSVAVEVPDEDRAHHARAQGNEIGLGLELCGTLQSRAQWLDAASLPTLINGARWTAEKCVKFGIPVVRLSVAQLRDARYNTNLAARPRGIVSHGDVTAAFPEDYGSHTDPGPNFPWDVFLGFVGDEVQRLKGGMPMAKIIKVTDGPVPGALFGTGGSGWFHIVDWDDLQAYAAEWGIVVPANAAFPAMTAAEARRRFGPYLGNSAQLAAGPKGDPGAKGDPGKDGIVLPHTHHLGDSIPAPTGK